MYDRKHNRFYAGFEMFEHKLKESFTSPSKIQVKGAIAGYLFGYSYICPYSVFLAADIRFDADKIKESNDDNLTKIKSKNNIENYEAQTGLSLGLGPYVLLIPFGGYGYYDWSRKIADQNYMQYDKIHYEWQYVCYGIHFLWEICPYLDIGMTIKMLELTKVSLKLYENDDYFLFEQTQKPTYKLSKKGQYELLWPIALHGRAPFLFDLTITPFLRDIRLRKGSEKKLFGQNLVSPPSSKTYEWGVKVSLGFWL